MVVKSKRPQDCVIVALANYFGKPYEDIEARLAKYGGPSKRGGYGEDVYRPVVTELLGRKPQKIVPRRGQDKMTGILRVARPGNKNGHLTTIIDGMVFDDSGDGDGEMCPIKQYRTKYGFNVKGVWK